MTHNSCLALTPTPLLTLNFCWQFKAIFEVSKKHINCCFQGFLFYCYNLHSVSVIETMIIRFFSAQNWNFPNIKRCTQLLEFSIPKFLQVCRVGNKLRLLGLMNRIVNDSDSNGSDFEQRNPSNSRFDDKFEAWYIFEFD